MNDLISRQAAIEALGERPLVWTDDDQYTLGERNQYDIDRLAIGTLPSAEVTLCHLDSPCEYQNADIALPSAQQWIPCSAKMPEEREWIGTKRFGTTLSDEVYVTFKSPNGERFTKHLAFQNGQLNGLKQQEIDAFHKGSVPIAWMPLPEPWKGEDD